MNEKYTQSIYSHCYTWLKTAADKNMKRRPPRRMWAISASHFLTCKSARRNQRCETWCKWCPRPDTTARHRGIPIRAYKIQNKHPKVVDGAMCPYPAKQERFVLLIIHIDRLTQKINNASLSLVELRLFWLKQSLYRWLSENCSMSFATGLEILQSCTKPSICLQRFDACPYKACYGQTPTPPYSLYYRYTIIPVQPTDKPFRSISTAQGGGWTSWLIDWSSLLSHFWLSIIKYNIW